MSYFAHTIRNHLKNQIDRFCSESSDGRKMIFMVPAMPEKTMLSVADAVASHCLQDDTLLLTLKIAASLTEKWTTEGQKTLLAKGWQDERGNLTYYRNLPETSGKCTLIVLCGADRVTDAAGLADFHTCNPEMIWRTDMEESFSEWVLDKLRASGIHDCSAADLVTCDRIIKPLLSCGRGDLLQISEWLELLDFNQAADVAEVPRIMLENMHMFGVPVLSRFPLSQKSKQLSLYINKSAEFYNYTLFLEARQRDKAIKTIDKILAQIEEGNTPNLPLEDEDVCGSYSSGEELIMGLKNYIETDDPADRARLMECDFVVIWDQILKFKMKEPKKERDSVRKLSGSPVEVLLTATWMTLRDYFLENKDETELKIDAISISTHQFKHDIDNGGDKEENAELARAYLTRLIGGIDLLTVQHVNLNNADGSEISMSCDLLASSIICVYSKSAEPVLEFDIEITPPKKPFKRRFGWRLPEHHMYRLSAELLQRASYSIGKIPGVHKLPVYHVAYYEELLQATADEEIRRVLLHSIRDERDSKKVLTNLLCGPWAQVTDPLSSKLKILAEKYHLFIVTAATNGILSSIFGGQSVWADLRKSYSDAFEEVSSLDDVNQSSMVGMLVRAFLIVGVRPLNLGDTWHADVYEPSGVATILHPSIVEMLEAQVVYLSHCFNYAVNMELGHPPSKDSFKAHIWRTYVDLASIQAPLTGLLYNEEKNLTAKVRGQELIHRIGSADATDTPLSTRLLLQYNENTNEDDSFSDTEMFRETSESKLLLRLMQDYFDLHPHARDGLSIAIFRNKDIQPVIAAVHAYLKILAKKSTTQQPNKRYVLNPDRERPYAISVTLFTESNDETDVSSWVQQWRERWEAAETESKYALYRCCRFSIAHRIVEKNGLSSFQTLINEQFEADIAVFYNFIGAGAGVNSFEKVEPFDITSRDLKFPILEKACCSITNPAEMYRRKRVVSNRQFSLAAYHANLLHALQSGSHQTGTVVVGSGDFTPWRGLIDCLHKKAEWIICIDPNMDERLIKRPLLNTDKTREIIGFGSGVGSHGEDNYTVSTEQFSFADIHVRLCSSIRQLYAPGAEWSVEDCEAVTQGVLMVAPELSGLSLVRATGVGDNYIHDFMANALTRKMLIANSTCLCESLISLDAYRHWFDLADNRRRPDLLWMQAEIGSNHRLHIKMQLIECKLGQASAEYVSKAKSQIDNGLKVLSSAFAPLRTDDGDAGLEDERPDRRYWWMQLHRLVASKAEVDRGRYPEVLAALERLAEGDFDISWSASVFAFWINQDTEIKRIGFWSTGESPTLIANVYSIGGGFVRQLATDPKKDVIDWAAMGGQGHEILDEEGESVQLEVDDDYTPWADDDAEEESEEDAPEEIVKVVTKPEPDIMPSDRVVVDNFAPEGIMNGSPKTSPPTAVLTRPVENAAPIIDEVKESPVQSGRILLGKNISNNQPVYWEFMHPDLANRHILIFGSSGQGKTYAIQGILCEMSRIGQHSLIVDYTDGFRPDHIENEASRVLSPVQHVVSNDPLPINPFIPQCSDSGGIQLNEKPGDVATRIASLFNAVYKIGDQQRSVLYEAVTTGVQVRGNGMNLSHMLELIDNLTSDSRYKGNAQKLYSKIKPFVDKQPFASGEIGFDWDSLFSGEDLCNVFQLAGMDRESGRLITEFVLWDLYGHLQSKGKKTDPKVLVLDEVQNLDHSEGSPLSKYLREGRKFGVSLLLATQIMSGMSKDERDRMFNAEHKLFFKPTDTELKAFAQLAGEIMQGSVNEWQKQLSSLQKGECYSIGQVLDEHSGKLRKRAVKIRITALEERGFNE